MHSFFSLGYSISRWPPTRKSVTPLVFHSFGFRSVVVITFASHAKGPRFETGRKHILTNWSFALLSIFYSDFSFSSVLIITFASQAKVSHTISFPIIRFPQCSGYHIRLTRERSRVRDRAETRFNKLVLRTSQYLLFRLQFQQCIDYHVRLKRESQSHPQFSNHSVSVVQWLSNSPLTGKIPGSKLGGNIL